MSSFHSELSPAHWQRVLASTPPAIWPTPTRPRGRRQLRVLYPPFVKRQLPKEDSCPARRWLLLLTAVVFLQIYIEEGVEGPHGSQIYTVEGLEAANVPLICNEEDMEERRIRTCVGAAVRIERPSWQRVSRLPLQSTWAFGLENGTSHKNQSDFMMSPL